MRCFSISVLVSLFFFSSSLCELSLEKQDRLLNDLIDYLNNLPNQPYVYEDGIFLKSSYIDANTYKIDIRAKVSEVKNSGTYRFQKCTATIIDLGDDGITIPNNEYQCVEWTDEGITSAPEAAYTDVNLPVSEEPLLREPIHLDNEVQPNNDPTSGEQFIAIPRDRSGPCIGCSTHVDTSAAGVDDLAALGAKHLDKHEPNIRHTVIAVHDVERQVQVINGIRYVLTLTIGYNNCTDSVTDVCVFDKICRVSVITKPWVKFPDGSKYKAITANNCTEQWLFGDNGEPISETLGENQPSPDNDKVANSGSADEVLKVVQNADILAQQTPQAPISNEKVKNIEEQIIPYSEFNKSHNNDNIDSKSERVISDSIFNKEPFENMDTSKKVDEDSIQVRNPELLENTRYITEDKKKAIEDMMNLFNFAEFQPLQQNTEDRSRGKRSYTNDLQVMSVLDKIQKIKRKLMNAQHIYKLGKFLVDYVNEMDMEVKTRVLKDVIFAEEEIEKEQHFFYIRVRVVIPCDKVECDRNDTQIKICNGVINSTDSKTPEVVDTFCYTEEKQSTLGNVKNVPSDDPILLKLINESIKKIEDDMHIGNALRIFKIIRANTQKVSGTLTKISMVLEFIDCHKMVPFYKRINCTTVQNLGTKICEIEIHERHWLKDKKITYTCTERTMDETIEENVHYKKYTEDTKVIEIVNEALQLLEVQSNKNNRQKIVEIKSISKQMVVGQLTNVEFVVGYTRCSINDIDIDVNSCELKESERLRQCQAQLWERPWLQEGRQMKVFCDDTNRIESNEIEYRRRKRSPYLRRKRQVPGGVKEGDVKDPKYLDLAQESLSKYLQESGNTKPHTVVKIDKVTVQVVAGTLTKLDFEVQSSGDVYSCHSEVWERPWLKSKEITVSCGKDLNFRQKRELAGGVKEGDAKDPKYMELAQESLSKYLQDSGNTKPHTVVKIDKVTVQVVAGTLTKLDFEVQSSGDLYSCHSEVWERPWLKSKEINVNCGKDQSFRQKRELVGGVKEGDAKDPKYMELAQESLSKYLQDSGNTKPHTVVKIDKVTVQVVAGTLTKLDFEVQSSGDLYSCHSEVWERPWLKSKEITVNCGKDQSFRQKRELAGGVKEGDAKDPKYMELAQESLSKYLQDSGNTKPHTVVKIDKVTVQVVAGTLTKLDFEVQSSGDLYFCHSEVWERPWLKTKEITVNCGKDQSFRQKRELAGGVKEGDAKDPKYMELAQESLSKYLQDSGNTKPHTVVKIDKVTVQVVAGTLTKLDFEVQSSGDVYSCHSEVWERLWLKSKEITVNCGKDQSFRQKRELAGGVKEGDAKDPKYMELAQESLSKYLQDSGNTKPHTVVKIDKVTVQVVAGTLTKLDFEVQSSGDVYSCHSEVWERPWLKSKKITVICGKDQNSQQSRLQRDIIVGGAIEEDSTNEKYMILAEESLHKYVENVGSTRVHKLIKLNRVMKQLVSGTITSLDFVISPTNCDVHDKSHKVCSVLENANIRCHSDIWERPWLQVDSKVIDVTCDDLTKDDANVDNPQGQNIILKEIKRDSKPRHNRFAKKTGRKSGGPVEQDPTKPLYRVLADEALRKYQLRQRSADHHEITHLNKVVSQAVSGMKYNIEFEVLRVNCPLNAINITKCDETNNITLTCHAVIWSRPWLKSKDINVGCSSDEFGNKDSEEEEEDTSSEEIKRKKRDVSFGRKLRKNPNDETYVNLASEVVKKYQKNVHADYIYKINKILRVTEHAVSGFVTNIDFTISPTTCLITDPSVDVDDCQLQQPKIILRCSAEVNEPSIPRSMKIKVGCKKPYKKINNKLTEGTSNRVKREEPYDDDYIDEDIKYYYADRAISDFNSRASTNNLYKVVSIHDVHRSVHMDTLMVRLYLEIAMTFCMRYGEEHDLQNCDEIDGMSHKLCLARVYPSPDDDLVVQHATMTCNDDENFEGISGISIDEFLRVSIAEIEKSPDIHFKLVPLGEPNVIPSLNNKMPVRMNFVVHHTNCSKDIDFKKQPTACVINPQRSGRNCHSLIYMMPNTKNIRNVVVKCAIGKQIRAKRSVSLDPQNATADDLFVHKMVQESIEKLEMASEHRYKQRVLVINSYASRIVSGRLTTIDFDVGYTTCLKYEWVENITSCEFLEHLPRRHCISHVWERLWVENGRHIEVSCEDDETPLEAHIEFESAENAMQLANEALKHIEAKYPNPRRQKIVRIFSLEKQAIAGLHYRMKTEVGVTNCMALSINDDCKLVNDMNSPNKFCRVNVWLRPWTDHPPSFRVTCDYQSGAMDEIYHHIQAERLFYDFLTTYKPDYLNDVTEMRNRFAIFKENVRKIHELNIYERGTARYAVTRFSDLSYEEFSSKYLGLKPELRDHNQVPMRMADIPNVELPVKYDWRDYGTVTEVKDQGSCGSCWAFSVTGNIEGQWKLQSGKLVSLSEQELVDCDDLDNGCNGGLPDNAYRAIEKLGGLETENDYPYEGADDKCAYNRTLSRVHISGAVNITSNETDMAKWLTSNGPISIGINANAMQFYVGGISHPWKMLCSPTNLDHGVLIVGYGVKDYPLFHKHLPYWIVKNSWGERWGEQGYYRVYRGDGTCGVNQMASSAVI